MAGRPGRSGGHNRIALEAHVLRGTFNATRHGHLASSGPVWDPPAAALEGLGAAGRAFVARLLAAYDLRALDGELALEGAVAADRLDELRTARRRASAKKRRELDRWELAWTRTLSTCVLALRVRLRATKADAAAPPSKWRGLV